VARRRRRQEDRVRARGAGSQPAQRFRCSLRKLRPCILGSREECETALPTKLPGEAQLPFTKLWQACRRTSLNSLTFSRRSTLGARELLRGRRIPCCCSTVSITAVGVRSGRVARLAGVIRYREHRRVIETQPYALSAALTSCCIIVASSLINLKLA
jgi:hypothetical protein